MEHELNDKITKIKQEFMNGKIAAKSFEKELHYLEKEIKNGNEDAKLTKILFDAQKGINAIDTMSNKINLAKSI